MRGVLVSSLPSLPSASALPRTKHLPLSHHVPLSPRRPGLLVLCISPPRRPRMQPKDGAHARARVALHPRAHASIVAVRGREWRRRRVRRAFRQRRAHGASSAHGKEGGGRGRVAPTLREGLGLDRLAGARGGRRLAARRVEAVGRPGVGPARASPAVILGVVGAELRLRTEERAVEEAAHIRSQGRWTGLRRPRAVMRRRVDMAMLMACKRRWSTLGFELGRVEAAS